ncbi:TerB family tellurite resistance protein [Gammaproteobacteria bacterium]|nr:TerB family tellurite resistance protein [Gammaproteobacteria bacterium]
MHILIGLLTAIASLIWALNRFGVDVNSFNPFHWHRRNKWKKQFDTKPLHLLKKPIEAAAVLLIGTVNAEGLISREQKAEVMKVFTDEFQQDQSTATDLFVSGTFMLKDVIDVAAEVPHILAPNKEFFTQEQSQSLLKVLSRMASLEGEMTQAQKDIVDAVETELLREKIVPGKW